MTDMHLHAAPHDVIGWSIVVVGAMLTIAVIAQAVYLTVRPGEMRSDHPKRLILKDDR